MDILHGLQGTNRPRHSEDDVSAASAFFFFFLQGVGAVVQLVECVLKRLLLMEE